MSAVRSAAFAGRFYPADADGCAAFVRKFTRDLPPERVAAGAGLIPHAGWDFSGPTALRTLRSLAVFEPEVVVIFGAVHVMDHNLASVCGAPSWETPVGPIEVDVELAARISALPDVVADSAIHRREHSIEVELPFLRLLLPLVKLVPIMIRPSSRSAAIGFAVAELVRRSGRRAAFLASTDLTHYGPAFDFEPAGRGLLGIRWAKDVNDRRFAAAVAALDPDRIVPEAAAHQNACGAGAVSATLAAATVYGWSHFEQLEHTSSFERQPTTEQADCLNSVGYLSAVLA